MSSGRRFDVELFKAENIRELFYEAAIYNGSLEIFGKLKFLELLCLEQHKRIKEYQLELNQNEQS